MKLGYILSQDKNASYGDFIRIKSLAEISEDIPVLIIGWAKAKELFPEEFKFNTDEINHKAFWAHRPFKDRLSWQQSLREFKDRCVNHKIREYEYEYYDLVQKDYEDLDFSQFESILSSGNLLYLLSVKRIVGISLELSVNLGYSILEEIKKHKIKLTSISTFFANVETRYQVCFSD